MKIESVHPAVFLDVAVGGKKTGRIVVGLFQDKAPLATENFQKLGPRLENTYFHRVIKNFMIQGGDITYAQADKYNDSDVGSGLHPDGTTFEDENLDVEMDRSFLVCMANAGPGTNGSQFFITTASTPHLKGKHTVFGQVIHGKSVVREIERVSTTPESVPLPNELPVIQKFGTWAEGDPVPVYNACYDRIGGDIYEEYPDDDENIDKESSQSVYEASNIIKDSGSLLLKKGEYEKARMKYKKSLRYVMEYISDEETDAEWNRKFGEVKKKLYLNLSLVCLKLEDYAKCVDYCTYLLDMELTQGERAKTLYRLGGAMMAGKKYKEAVKIFETAKEFSNDAGIAADLKKAEELLQRQKDAEKAKYAKFFG